jgi:hypothetical protein
MSSLLVIEPRYCYMLQSHTRIFRAEPANQPGDNTVWVGIDSFVSVILLISKTVLALKEKLTVENPTTPIPR